MGTAKEGKVSLFPWLISRLRTQRRKRCGFVQDKKACKMGPTGVSAREVMSDWIASEVCTGGLRLPLHL
jgi:hypothetical protein